MHREELLKIWAPDDSPWSPWTKAVLFSFMPEEVAEGSLTPVEARWLPRRRDTALVVELPGAEGVQVGLSLARVGYRPVPLYNACPFPVDLLEPSVTTKMNVPTAVETTPIMRALARGGDALQTLDLPPSAPPAFLLDADRHGPPLIPVDGWFDNRSVVRESDVPTAAFLREQGIRQVVLVQGKPDLRSDLRNVLLAWQEGELTLSRQRASEPWDPQVFRLKKPWWLRVWWDRFVQFGYPLNQSGSFGRYLHGSGG